MDCEPLEKETCHDRQDPNGALGGKESTREKSNCACFWVFLGRQAVDLKHDERDSLKEKVF